LPAPIAVAAAAGVATAGIFVFAGTAVGLVACAVQTRYIIPMKHRQNLLSLPNILAKIISFLFL
jgi:hypothetical protein